MNVLYGYENDRGRLGVFSTAVPEWCCESILSLDRYSHEYRSAYIAGRAIAEKDGDGCTGRDVVVYADDELFEGSMREGVP
jgi:transposase InsO family protein